MSSNLTASARTTVSTLLNRSDSIAGKPINRAPVPQPHDFHPNPQRLDTGPPARTVQPEWLTARSLLRPQLHLVELLYLLQHLLQFLIHVLQSIVHVNETAPQHIVQIGQFHT